MTFHIVLVLEVKASHPLILFVLLFVVIISIEEGLPSEETNRILLNLSLDNPLKDSVDTSSHMSYSFHCLLLMFHEVFWWVLQFLKPISLFLILKLTSKSQHVLAELLICLLRVVYLTLEFAVMLMKDLSNLGQVGWFRGLA